jgi:hypothetical protein
MTRPNGLGFISELGTKRGENVRNSITNSEARVNFCTNKIKVERLLYGARQRREEGVREDPTPGVVDERTIQAREHRRVLLVCSRVEAVEERQFPHAMFLLRELKAAARLWSKLLLFLSAG